MAGVILRILPGVSLGACHTTGLEAYLSDSDPSLTTGTMHIIAPGVGLCGPMHIQEETLDDLLHSIFDRLLTGAHRVSGSRGEILGEITGVRRPA